MKNHSRSNTQTGWSLYFRPKPKPENRYVFTLMHWSVEGVVKLLMLMHRILFLKWLCIGAGDCFCIVPHKQCNTYAPRTCAASHLQGLRKGASVFFPILEISFCFLFLFPQIRLHTALPPSCYDIGGISLVTISIFNSECTAPYRHLLQRHCSSRYLTEYLIRVSHQCGNAIVHS